MSVQASLNYLVPSDLLVVRNPVGLVLRAPLGRLVPLEVVGALDDDHTDVTHTAA